jgi:hypothetical protein
MVSQGHLSMMSSSISALPSALFFFLWPCHSQTMPTYLQEDHPTECAFLCHAGRWFDCAYRTWTFDFVAHVKHLDAPIKDVLRQYLHFWAGWHGHDLPTNAWELMPAYIAAQQERLEAVQQQQRVAECLR